MPGRRRRLGIAAASSGGVERHAHARVRGRRTARLPQLEADHAQQRAEEVGGERREEKRADAQARRQQHLEERDEVEEQPVAVGLDLEEFDGRKEEREVFECLQARARLTAARRLLILPVR